MNIDILKSGFWASHLTFNHDMKNYQVRSLPLSTEAEG
jgi:hypothetical protein